MNAKRRIRRSRGYISYVMVLSIGAVLTMLMVYAYRDASQSMVVASSVQQRADYLNKEDAALRSMLAIVPNRAIRAMQSGSAATEENKAALTWQAIFQEALTQANAGTSISAAVAEHTNLDATYSGNTGDSTLNNVSLVFNAVTPETGYVASGCSNLGANFPPALNTTDVNTAALDKLYPIISSSKFYGDYASASGRVGASVTDYPQFNLIPYPSIDFGYGTQGENFVAKRNWWAFSVNLYNHNNAGGTTTIDQSRDYVLSIYEIPSQLSISSNAFTSIGQHASGAAWQNITVAGAIYASKANVEGSTALSKLSSRRGMSLSSASKIGALDQSSTSNPFAPGLRETYEITTGEFYPVSLSSETGRAAFVPINRGTEFFDRFANATENSTLSPTTWNNYSVGALQCAMKLDVTEVISSTNQTPTKLRFTYKAGGNDQSTYVEVPSTDATVPFDVTVLSNGRACVVIKPELLPAYLLLKGADGVSVNNSIAVNADYTTNTLIKKPSYPCTDKDIGLIMKDCANLSAFTKGFSVVTNFRLYIADHFNTVATTAPAGITGTFYPPTSLYAPERRYGSDKDPTTVTQAGTIGSLASDDSATPIRPLDLKNSVGTDLAANKITVNLSPITHPGALPPITMMNWLIVLEEKRKEFYTSVNSASGTTTTGGSTTTTTGGTTTTTGGGTTTPIE